MTLAVDVARYVLAEIRLNLCLSRETRETNRHHPASWQAGVQRRFTPPRAPDPGTSTQRVEHRTPRSELSYLNGPLRGCHRQA